MSMRLSFWLSILRALIHRGLPLSHTLHSNRLNIGLLNRGLLSLKTLTKYEPGLQLIIYNESRDFFFFDIGANIGLMSCIALINPACKSTVCIEPSPYNIRLLLTNLHVFSRSKPYVLIPAIYSDSIDDLYLDSSKRNAALFNAVSATDAPYLSEASSYPKVTTDFLCQLLSLHPPSSCILKIDIEGSERTLNYALLLSSYSLRSIIVEVWDLSTLQNIRMCAAEYSFTESIYNSTFDSLLNHIDHDYRQWPVNLYLNRQ